MLNSFGVARPKICVFSKYVCSVLKTRIVRCRLRRLGYRSRYVRSKDLASVLGIARKTSYTKEILSHSSAPRMPPLDGSTP